MRTFWIRVVVCFVITNLAALLHAQQRPSIVPEDYGVHDYNYTVIPARDFRPEDSVTGYVTDPTGTVYRFGGGSGRFSHVVTLPAGAVLADITAYVSDTNATFDVTVNLVEGWRVTDTGANVDAGIFASGHSTGAPGATSIVIPWNNTLPTLQPIFGNGVLYDLDWSLVVQLDATDSTNSFNGVRLKWKRQVSPAPTTATFADVPTTHPFFRFVEALYASGITAGCNTSPPQFCPDAPVTRGQMAVFLSAALGLHWAP